jgi:LysM repeat protein
MSGELKKAQIKVLNGKQKGTKIECAFNPQEYQLTKRVEYDDHTTLLNVPVKQFTNGSADRLSMELFFDTTKTESDVRSEYLDAIDSLLEVDGKLHAPPRCQFVWGGGLSFKAVLVEASKRFTRFLSDGTPVRAWVDVTFEQYKTADEQKSAIKHESTDKTKVWTVTEGDTLWLIAQEEYGDPAHWRTIARANDVVDPRSLESGTELSLPPL